VITWGAFREVGTAIWLARSRDGGDWKTQRIQTVTGWVNHYQAVYASNSRGDLAIVSGAKGSSGFIPQFRFAAAGHRLGKPIELTDYECFSRYEFFCAGVAIGEDGTAILAYQRSVDADNLAIDAVRRSPDGTLGPAQQVSDEFSKTGAHGVSIAVNRRGDAVVSMQAHGLGFVRCPVASPCVAPAYLEGEYPDRWRTSLGDDAEATVTWPKDEWLRNLDIVTRQLAAVE
jgi:hypothetical protein